MNVIQVDKAIILNCVEYGEGCTEYSRVEESAWEADGKYQLKEYILERNEDNTYWSYISVRSGSPFSDYYYPDEESSDKKVELVQVEKVKVTTTEWKAV